MYDGWKIIIGILVFILVFTIPLWLNIVNKASTDIPELELPSDYKECIASKEYMRAYHMDILDEWRDKVVRQDIRMFNFKDQVLEMSLTKTCMKCHDSKQNFCDRCHNYFGVKPYCWDCHITPEEVKKKFATREALNSLSENSDNTNLEGR